MKKFLFLFLFSFASAQYSAFDATQGFTFSSGAGAAVTQATSRTTGVTINNVTGQITTNTTSLAAGASATFIVTDSKVGLHDVVVLSIQSGTNSGRTIANVTVTTAGTFSIMVSDLASATAETGAVILNFVVIKGISS